MKFRTGWYREQVDAWEAMMAAKIAARRRRPRARMTETWSHLETASVTLADLLDDVLQTMGGARPGQPAPEVSVSLFTDLADDPPEVIEPPYRAKPVNPMGRRRVGTNGKVETHAELARIEITARLVIYGPPGEAPPPEMMRRTWFLPTKTAEKRENSPGNLDDGNN